ncbi:hypothetical protein C7455_11238 [Roseicyclus mahoneyensis]|uniref:Uncharacterized protein n=2 Tax=Roseicyclus mahoneyensis TaxID=164332 RepID=A0A316G9L1_9RHOB|nr:hypothetical protein C7455_11238 [Roseicyclus mahoneyensis]
MVSICAGVMSMVRPSRKNAPVSLAFSRRVRSEISIPCVAMISTHWAGVLPMVRIWDCSACSVFIIAYPFPPKRAVLGAAATVNSEAHFSDAPVWIFGW